MNFFKRLFGALSGADKPAAQATPVTPASPPPAPAKPAVPRLFIGWEEMIDSRSSIGGYRLRPQHPQPGARLDAGSLRQALLDEHIERFAAQRPLLIPLLAAHWSELDFRPLIARHTYFLITDLFDLDEGQRQALRNDIHQSGAQLAANAHDMATALQAQPDLLVFDFRATALPHLEQTLQTLRRAAPQIQTVADGVHSWAEHRLCQSLGFRFSLGSFAASRDEDATAGKISESRMTLIEMLNQIRNGDDLANLANTAMRDPAVVVKLLDMANSPIYGLPRRVANLEEAMLLLGRDALYRWLSLAMFQMDANSGHDRTLLVIALCRAALLEGLVKDTDRRLADELFLVGLLSVIDSLLRVPMADILAHIRLPEKVAAVLLRSEGEYARYLQLALLIERCRLDQAVVLAGALNLSPHALIDSYREALGWASSEVLGSPVD